MPELPEIETIRRGLVETVLDRPILSVAARGKVVKDGSAAFGAALEGRRFTGLERRGKMLIFSLSRKRSDRTAHYLLARLGMTGRLLYAGKGETEGGKHCFMVIRFRGASLSYCDPRQFGSLRVVDAAGLERRLQEFGPEPLDKKFTPGVLRRVLAGSRTSIKALLLDQKRIAGIGNIYADEVLFASGVDPRRRADSLTRAEADRLHGNIKRILRRAIVERGTTVSDYVDAAGRRGGYQRFLRVYGRAGKECPVCGGTVQRLQVAGRGTHYCPKCQK